VGEIGAFGKRIVVPWKGEVPHYPAFSRKREGSREKKGAGTKEEITIGLKAQTKGKGNINEGKRPCIISPPTEKSQGSWNVGSGAGGKVWSSKG